MPIALAKASLAAKAAAAELGRETSEHQLLPLLLTEDPLDKVGVIHTVGHAGNLHHIKPDPHRAAPAWAKIDAAQPQALVRWG